MSTQKINSLKDLYQEMDNLYKEIYKFCKICEEEDCKGYIWLLPEEAKKIFDKNISLVEINKRLNFLNFFSKENGVMNLEEINPPCLFRGKKGKCTIYLIRPLICRLYPLDLRIFKNQFYIVLHTDCFFVKNLIRNRDISQFLDRVINIFYNLNIKLLIKILKEYRLVSSVLKYPQDYKHNDYIKILKVINFKKTKIKVCQNVKQFSILEK